MAVTLNGSQGILHGYLDPSHISDLSAYWVNRPTPWPFVLASVSLSLILGFLGVQASYKSWESKPNALNCSDASIALSSPTPPPINPTAYQPLHPAPLQSRYRRFSSASSTTYAHIIENDAMDTYFADRQPSQTSMQTFNSYTMHGGLGRFALITTAIGISWSTMRTGALLAILVKITLGERHTYPGTISVVIMFASVQTYLGSRAMPRILYLLIITDMLAIYSCVVLAILSFLRDRHTSYQEFGVSGGSCPCMLGFKTGHDMKSCRAFAENLPSTIGCDATFLWTNNTAPGATGEEMTYPKSCLLSDAGDKDLDPNLMTYMVLAEVVVGGVGLLYGLIVLCFASRWIPRALAHPSRLFDALALNAEYTTGSNSSTDSHKMPGRAIGMTVLAFVALLMFAAVTIVVHVLDETSPIRLFYMDSVGPLVDRATAVGGGSWSDCFEVDTPFSTDGNFGDWWARRQSRVLRALALA